MALFGSGKGFPNGLSDLISRNDKINALRTNKPETLFYLPSAPAALPSRKVTRVRGQWTRPKRRSLNAERVLKESLMINQQRLELINYEHRRTTKPNDGVGRTRRNRP